MSTIAPAELHEAGGRIAYREGTGDKYKVRIMGWEPGAEYAEGSSALYPVDALKRDIPLSFPEGTRMRANHDGLCEAGGDIRRVIARTIDTPWEEADGMYTNMRVSKEWSGYVKEYGDIIGLSISAGGELQQEEDEDGDMVTRRDEATGLPILKRLLNATESPYNSIDFVEAPGADGRIVMAIESAKGRLAEMNIREQASFVAGIGERKDSEAVPPQSNKEENSMDDKEMKAILAQEREATLALVSATIAEALAPAEAPKVEIQFESVAEAAFKAGLSEAGREGVYERVRGGVSVEDAIAKESAREEAITASVKEKPQKESAPAGFGYTSDESAGGGSVTTESLDAEFEKMLGE